MSNGNGNSSHSGTSDWNIKSITPMPSPGELKEEIILPDNRFEEVVAPARSAIENILAGEDRRLLAIVGPCSIHNTNEAREYAGNLAQLASEVKDGLFVVMRTCLDKPRSGKQWPGFFQDPDLNCSRNIDKGWREGRRLLVDIVSMGLPVGMELLDADACQNIDECVSYWWVGARTVTSQRLREIASGLSTPVGFKNPTDGRIDDAVEAIDTAWHDSAFIATNGKGCRSEYRTKGNKHGHLILRGSNHGPNYGPEVVEQAVHKLASRGLPTKLLIDVSHGNSGKDHLKQREVIRHISDRLYNGDQHIGGFLYESYLESGNQKLPLDLSDLKPRISVTDGCDDWATTREVLLRLNDKLLCFKPSPEK